MIVDFTYPNILFFSLRWPAGIKVLILDSVSVLYLPLRASPSHPFTSRPTFPPGLLRAAVADWWWPLRPRGEALSWAAPPAVASLGLWAAAESSRPLWPDKGSLPSHCVRQEEGCREEERAAGCCPPKEADNRGSRKNTSFYPCSLRQKPCTAPLSECLAPLFSASLPQPPLTLP